jgi:hypothetical protein
MGLFDLVRAACMYNKRVSVVALQMQFAGSPRLSVTRDGAFLLISYFNPAQGANQVRIPMEGDEVLYRDLLDAFTKLGVPRNTPLSDI